MPMLMVAMVAVITDLCSEDYLLIRLTIISSSSIEHLIKNSEFYILHFLLVYYAK